MNARLVLAGCWLLVWAATGENALAQPGGYYYPPPAYGVPAEWEASGVAHVDSSGPAGVGYALSDPFGPLVRLETGFGNGLGWEDAYYGVNAFLPRHVNPGEDLIFLAINGFVTEEGRGVGNLGLGFRHYSSRFNRIFGVSGWGDIDDRSATFYRAGASIETLGQHVDVRVNTYKSFGTDAHVVEDRVFGDPVFAGNRILLDRLFIQDEAFSGAEFEIGGPMPFLGRHGVNAYFGVYYLFSEIDDAENTTGFKARAQAYITEDLTMSVSHAYDDLFGSNTWFNFVLTLPDGIPSKWFQPKTVRERLGAPVERSDRIHIFRRYEIQHIPAVNPIDNEPYTVVHVDPNQSARGDGTFERPLNNLDNFTNNPQIDIIRVIPRSDDTSTNLRLNATLALFDNQRLLSSNRQHVVEAVQATFLLPGFRATASGLGPIVTHIGTTPSAVVSIASNNEISGLVIDGSGVHDGIVDSVVGGDVFGFNINNNIIENARNGVVLTNAIGTVDKDRPGIFTANIVRNNAEDGFRLTNTTKDGVLDLSLTNNQFLNNGPTQSPEDAGPVTGATAPPVQGGAGVRIATAGLIRAHDPDADLPLGILNNIAVGNGSGMSLTANPQGTILAHIEGNIFDDNTDNQTGLSVVADGGQVVLSSVTNNSFSGNEFVGFSVAARNQGELFVTKFTNNLLADNGMGGIVASATGRGNLVFNIGRLVDDDGNDVPFPSNIITGNGLFEGDADEDQGKAGIRIMLADRGIADVTIVNNNIDDNGRGLLVDTPMAMMNAQGIIDAGDLNLLVRQNTFNRATRGAAVGIEFDTKGVDLTATIAGNRIMGNFGLMPDPLDPDPANPTLPLVAVAPDLSFGMLGKMRDGTYDLTIGGPTVDDVNIFDQNVGAGIALRFVQDATGTFNILNNLVLRSNITAVFDTANPPATLPTPVSPIFLGDGIHIRLEGTEAYANAQAVAINSRIEGNAIGDRFDTSLGNEGHGLAIFAAEESRIENLTIAHNIIAFNGNDRRDFDLDPVTGLPTRNAVVDDDDLQNDGLKFTLVDDAIVRNVVVRNNIIDRNTGDGVDIRAAHGVDALGTRLQLMPPAVPVAGFTIRNNLIRNNLQHGIHLTAEADARLLVDILENVLDRNGDQRLVTLDPATGFSTFEDPVALGSGIYTEERFFDVTDMREIGGLWERNLIRNNVGYGIRLDATAMNMFNDTIVDPITGLTVNQRLGLMPNELEINGNLIEANGLDGIEFNGSGMLTIDSNLIARNGFNAREPVAGTDDQDGIGIDIQSVMIQRMPGTQTPGGRQFFTETHDQTVDPETQVADGQRQTASPKLVNINRNIIRENRGDGLEIRHANNPSSLHDAPLHPGHFLLTVVARENTIEFNGGRGVDILNQGGHRMPQFADPDMGTGASPENQFSPTDTVVRLIDNKIASNAKEGVYVVNTASLTQDQTGPTPVPADPEDETRGMEDDGSIQAVPRLALEVHHNLIIKNGADLDEDAVGGTITTLGGAGLVIRVGTSDSGSLLDAGSDFATGAPLFSIMHPGGVAAKITENTFKGNFGTDVYIESFTSTPAGATRPVIARLDLVFENNIGDSLDATNFGAFYGTNPRANAQRASSLLALPGGLTEIFGRVVGLHITSVSGGPVTDTSGATPIPNALPTASSFDGLDAADVAGVATPLVDNAGIYDGRELVFRSGLNADEARIIDSYSGAPLRRFTLDAPLPNVPALGDSFQVELSSTTIFDVVLLDSDPRLNPNAQPLALNLATGAFAGLNAILRFIGEDDVPDSDEPARNLSTTITTNWELMNGQTTTLANLSPFHVRGGMQVDNLNAVPGSANGPVASDATGKLPGTTSNQTLQVAALPVAPRDENLFVITAIQAGTGEPTFRVAGAMVASGMGTDTNTFNNQNLGFAAKVSLESGLPLGDELPFEWGFLPTANRQRILDFFAPLTPLPPRPATIWD